MIQLSFITTNTYKLNEAKSIFQPIGIEIVGENIKLIEPNDLSQEEITIFKAKQAFEKIKKPLIVDDTNIYFSDYDDFPGIYTKKIIQSVGIEGIKKLLIDKSKNAYFKTIIVYIDSKGHKIYEGICKGALKLNTEIKIKDQTAQFSSFFIPEGHSKTMSEFSDEDLKNVSHRYKALKLFFNDLNNRVITCK
ncbi:MAG: non-canonical purine NTP pyrophosphatase [Candidatus Nanoarchaeia archaeon]|nr:non-canonical purine NTP pyrophosphatase [Candidatus Nanoarchaeia archaeon]